MQAKAFARSNGLPSEKYYEDRAIVNFIATDCFMFDNSTFCNYVYDCQTSTENGNLFDPHVILNLLIGIILVVNILLTICSLANIQKISLWIQRLGEENILSKRTLNERSALYICFPLFFFFFDIIFVSLIFSNIAGVSITVSKIHIITTTLKFFMVIILPLVEITCLCGYKLIDKHRRSRHHIQVSVSFLFFLIWFAHRILIDICVSSMFFIISPAQTLGIIALLFFAILCAFVIFVLLVENKYWLYFVSVLYCLVFSFIIMVIVLFIALVDNGLQSSGMGGFILSIIPPIIAGIAGVYLKRLLFKAPNMHTGSLTNLNLIEHPARDQGSDNN